MSGLVETVILNDSYHIITVDRHRHIVFDRARAFVDRLHSEIAAQSHRHETEAALLPFRR